MKKIAATCAVLCLMTMPQHASSAAFEPEFKPQSAAELGGQVGLEFLQPIIIGDSDSVKAGKVPLAGTLNITYGKLVPPANVPPFPPPAQRKILPQEDFDEYFFDKIEQYPYKTILFEKIFEQGESDRYKFLTSELKYAWVPPPMANEEGKGKKSERKKVVRPIKKKQERPERRAASRKRGTMW